MANLSTKIIYGTLTGAAVGAGVATIGHIMKMNTHEKIKEEVLLLYPELSDYSFLLNNVCKLKSAISASDFSLLCKDISQLVKMQDDGLSNSIMANRVSERCIKKYHLITRTLRLSQNTEHRLLADELDAEEFEMACRDIIHNMLLRSPQLKREE